MQSQSPWTRAMFFTSIAILACTTTLWLTDYYSSQAIAEVPYRANTETQNELSEQTQKIINEVINSEHAPRTLKEITDIGPRLSGSAEAQKAVEWAQYKLKSYNFDRVYLQPVQVPKWTRGSTESAAITYSSGNTAHGIRLDVAALGGSVGTPTSGLEASVIEVQSLKEVERLGRNKIAGKIVFFNRPMDPSIADTFDAYSEAVDQRAEGAVVASRFGAVATLVRSVTTLDNDNHPHTGALYYEDNVKKIPAAALSTASANMLSQKLKEFPKLKVQLNLSAQNHEPVTSYNVIGEVIGRSLPNEYVVVGGHLDSWDLSPGAHDNASGATHAIEAGRAILSLNSRPKRTLRVVLFMSEEFGGYGGQEYAKQAKLKNETHIGAIESDRGGFDPRGISVEATPEVLNKVKSWAGYLSPLNVNEVFAGWSGVDVEPLNALGCATFGLALESKHYFDYHHSALDVYDAVNPSELKRGAAMMAAWAYLLAEEGLK